jgi:hypothetical protein
VVAEVKVALEGFVQTHLSASRHKAANGMVLGPTP